MFRRLLAKTITSQNDRDHMLPVIKYFAKQLGLKKTPKLKMIRDSDANAWVYGLSRRNERSTIYLTTSLVKYLDSSELDVVVAHEMGHIKDNYRPKSLHMKQFVNVCRLITICFLMSIVTIIISLFINGYLVWIISNIVMVTLFLLAYLVSKRIPDTHSIKFIRQARQKEFRADEISLKLTNDLPTTIHVLRFLRDKDEATLSSKGLHQFEKLDIHSRHPSANERINHLKHFASQIE